MTWVFGGMTPGHYSAILADPPWSYRMYSEAGHDKSPEAHYRTMPMPQIARLPVRELAAADCYLFLWSTWPHLLQALHVMTAWGFDYVTGGSWTKRTINWNVAMGTGFVLRSATEPFLVGKIGAPRVASRSARNHILAPRQVLQPADIPDSIEAIRREHSRKPVQMREMIERLVPFGPRCELFGREAWPGNAVWGNEPHRFDAGLLSSNQFGDSAGSIPAIYGGEDG